MPQLDFTIWLINLTTCWMMFFLVFTATNNITNNTFSKEGGENIINTNNSNWPW
uniref:ATP synthase complex subunit 8 n=1 Tax=Ophiura sarsii TaxID=861515 RepID=A0A5J6BV43_9ECHI|nr:ATP synthase F0 subunit 8 [Ophiura sarsii]QEP94701.1 ATP synthase F0 subunit 8 [Ophiura sarsii]QHT54198.1 ATP synthase F0 subunit 8 [Ophiura sarsii]QYF07884.1 ATP synthase F0 subunit 8 [Ophiura sarsii]